MSPPPLHLVLSLTRSFRPVGPGYDKGKGERLREEVDRRYRCDFFKWSSDVRRETKNGSSAS